MRRIAMILSVSTVFAGASVPEALAQQQEQQAQQEERPASTDDVPAPQARERPMIEEVIVTARRREEALQDTPVAVTAFAGEQLIEAGIYNILDLEKNVPSLSVSEDGTKTPKFFIRGIGQRAGNTIFDPGVGIYLNGVLIPRPEAQLLETVDIESVQILRGPQGTLFGKNNVGGAILFQSRKPDLYDLGGSISGRVGNFGRQDARVVGNIPLIEGEMGLRLSVSRTQLDGFLRNVVDGDEFGDEDRWAVSGRFLWDPNRRISLDLFGFWSRTREQGQGMACVFQNPDASLPNLIFPAQPNFTDACRESERLAPDRRVAINSERSVFELDSSMLALTLDWEVNENLSLKSITAYSRWDDVVTNEDPDASRAAMVSSGTLSVVEPMRGSGLSAPNEDRWQVTQEFQFNGSALDRRLHYTAGLFGSIERIDNHPNGQLVGPKGVGGIVIGQILETIDVPPEFEPLLALFDPTDVVPFVEWLGTLSDMRNESVAIFGEVSHNFTDWVELTVGGRLTSERRKRDLTITDVDVEEMEQRIGSTRLPEDFGNLFFPIPREQFDALADDPRPLAVTDPFVFSSSERFTEFTPSATLTLRAPSNWLNTMRLDSFMTYFTASRGFKAGGFDAKGRELVEVKPEFADNFEWGFKLDAVDRRFRMNGALFYAEWTDMQLQVNELGANPLGTEILSFFDNVGEATIKGVELESSFTFGNWFVQSHVSYLDHEINEFIGRTVVPLEGEQEVDRSGEPLFMTPEWSLSLAAQYTWIRPMGLIMPRLAFSYRDEVFTGMDFQAADFDSSTISDFWTLDFRLMYMREEWLRVTGFVDNVTDEFFATSGFANSGAQGASIRTLGKRRSYGVELMWEF